MIAIVIVAVIVAGPVIVGVHVHCYATVGVIESFKSWSLPLSITPTVAFPCTCTATITGPATATATITFVGFDGSLLPSASGQVSGIGRPPGG